MPFGLWTECVGLVPALLGDGGDERPGAGEVLGGLSEHLASRQDHSQTQQSQSAYRERAHSLHGPSPLRSGCRGNANALVPMTTVAGVPPFHKAIRTGVDSTRPLPVRRGQRRTVRHRGWVFYDIPAEIVEILRQSSARQRSSCVGRIDNLTRHGFRLMRTFQYAAAHVTTDSVG